MPSKEPKEGRCGSKVKHTPDDWDDDQEGYCMNIEGYKCDNPDADRCYLHGGVADNGAPEGNNNAEKHGLKADRQNYYENRSYKEQQWIDAVIESLLDDAPFGADNFAKFQMLRNVAIDMHKMQNANEYIDEVGVVHRDKTVGYTDDGKPIKVDEENVVNVAYDRLQKGMIRSLKELGCLEDPDSQQAEADKDIASELAKMRESREEES